MSLKRNTALTFSTVVLNLQSVAVSARCSTGVLERVFGDTGTVVDERWPASGNNLGTEQLSQMIGRLVSSHVRAQIWKEANVCLDWLAAGTRDDSGLAGTAVRNARTQEAEAFIRFPERQESDSVYEPRGAT